MWGEKVWILVLSKLSSLCLGAFTSLPTEQMLSSPAGSSCSHLNGHKLQLIHLLRWSLEARIEAHVRAIDIDLNSQDYQSGIFQANYSVHFMKCQRCRPNAAAEKLCYDTIFPKLPIWEASHSESHRSGLPAGHQLFTTCSFTSSRRICIIYSSLRSLWGWTVPEHRDKIVFLRAFAGGMSGGENSIGEAGNFSQNNKIRELDFLIESIMAAFGKSSMTA